MKSQRAETLRLRQEQIKSEITDCLDLIQGSVNRPPSQRGFMLTSKLAGKTVSRYVRKECVPQVQAMTRKHLKLRTLIRELSSINWELFQLQSENWDTAREIA